MKVLVTGGTGFLGGALTRRLHNMGWDVTALGRNIAKLDQLESEGIRVLQVDLKDKNALSMLARIRRSFFIALRCRLRGEILKRFIRQM